MAGPLSPLSPPSHNARTPETGPRTCNSTISFMTAPSAVKLDFNDDEITWDDNASSPFQPEVDENVPPGGEYQELETPSKRRSPLKMTSPYKTCSPRATPPRASPSHTLPASTRSMRSAITAESTPKAGNTVAASVPSTARRSPLKDFTSRLEEADAQERTLRDNEGLTMTMKMMDAAHSASSRTNSESSEVYEPTSFSIHEDATIDDTCFSTFSEIPNADMTMFAKLGQRSPTKTIELATPRAGRTMTPKSSRRQDDDIRSASPTPRRGNASPAKDGDTTNLLIDFTQQFESFSLSSRTSPSKRATVSPTKMNTEPDLRSFLNSQRSPGKQSKSRAAASTPTSSRKTILNLLDFELPPAPTPRSMPTITIRELESLKSQHLSELSSLKATLSGREAEVDSLKRAVGDAERRAGEAAETVREERSAREHAEREQAEWERRGKDFEDVLRKIKEEVIAGEREKEELSRRLEDAERRAEEAEAARSDAEARAAEAASKVFRSSAADRDGRATGDELFTAEQVQRQIDEKIHALSTELHAIYKKKHVTKVASLKKGFEAKTKERTAELEKKVEELTQQNEDLQTAKDATLSGVHVLPSELGALQEDRKRFELQKAEFEEQKARLAGLAEEVRSVKAQHATLVQELEAERVEKGELVAAVDEMLALQSEVGAPAAVEDLRKSISRPSGLRGPGFGTGESRIGKAPSLNRSTSSSLASSIARMGAAGR